jgi:excisionase family DNA binding protein
MDEEYFTIEEVAERLKVSRGAVYKWMAAGELPYVIVGRHRRITGAALRAFVKPGKAEDVRGEEESNEEWQALQLAAA